MRPKGVATPQPSPRLNPPTVYNTRVPVFSGALCVVQWSSNLRIQVDVQQRHTVISTAPQRRSVYPFSLEWMVLHEKIISWYKYFFFCRHIIYMLTTKKIIWRLSQSLRLLPYYSVIKRPTHTFIKQLPHNVM